MSHHRRHHHRRHRNPFASANMTGTVVKVAGGLAGGIAAGTLPNMVAPSFASGWTGVASAAVVAVGGSILLKRMSLNASEGWLIGGLLQTAGRVAQLLIGKNLVSFSLSGYGPLTFPLPTPAYGGGGAAAMIPAGAAVAKTGPGNVTSMAAYTRSAAGSRTSAKYNKFAA